jgi:hypothetical protein
VIIIDGSEGEGGGQILRTSLALSLVTGQPFRMEHIRAKRQKPDLLRQHLTAVEAAKMVGCAEVVGADMNSQTLEFQPGPVTPGNYRFAVGTAGSATLVLQTVLPSLLTASGKSTLTLEGGTHNPLAPPLDFLARSFMPLIHRMGPSVEFAPFTPPEAGSDAVVLAGDIHTGHNGLKWALNTFPDRPVIYVLGNHEFYGQKLQKLIWELREMAGGTNIHLLATKVVPYPAFRCGKYSSNTLYKL